MFYVYVLLSQKDRNFYVGYTEDLAKRMDEHGTGLVISTRNRRPMQLVYYEGSINKKDAMHREKYLKTTWGKRYLKNRLKYFISNI
jgi:putative endonuclease